MSAPTPSPWIIAATVGGLIVIYAMKGMMKGRKSPLLQAAAKGDGHAVARLLKAGADINASNGTGATALTCAAENGHAKVVDYLLQKGASVDAIAGDGKKNKVGMTALMLAAQNGNAAIVGALLEKGADMKIQNKSGQTALMLAAFKGSAAAVKLLLDKGADVRIKDNWGRNAWNWAQESKDPERMALLKRATFKDMQV
jgi:ankyrin repeat protein